MRPAARIAAAIEILEGWSPEGLPLDRLVDRYVSDRRYIGSKDRRAIRENVYRTIRHWEVLGWHVTQVGGGLSARARVLASVLMLGDEPVALESVCDGSPHAPAALDDQEKAGFEALVGRALLPPEMPEYVRWNLPEWLYAKMVAQYGTALPALLEGLQGEAPTDVRANRLRIDRTSLQAALAKHGIASEPTPYSPDGLRLQGRAALDSLAEFRQGWFEVQDEGSQIAAALVGVAPNMRVLDFCAGAGGKSLAMAAIMDNEGEILACDLDERRLSRLLVRAQRAGAECVRTASLEAVEGLFARVVVDAPCSGSGTWRRQPESRWRYGPEQLESLRKTQHKLLRDASRYVAVDGCLVYMTCSILFQENQEQVQRFLSDHPHFVLLSEPPSVVLSKEIASFVAGDTGLQIAPHSHTTDAFYVAILRRTQ